MKPEEMTELHKSVTREMVAVQLRIKEYHDKHWKPDPNLQAGDRVWVLPCKINTTKLSKKQDYGKIGPFKVLLKIWNKRIEAGLTTWASMAIHNTFNIFLLEPYQNKVFPLRSKNPFILFTQKEQTNMNSTKSLTLNSTTRSSNPELGGKAIYQNTTKSGTRQKT